MSETKTDRIGVVVLVVVGFAAGVFVSDVLGHIKHATSRPTSALTLYRFVDQPDHFLACFDADSSSCRLTTVIDVTAK